MKKIFLAFFLLSSIVFAANTIELTGEYAKDLGNPFRVLLEKKDKNISIFSQNNDVVLKVESDLDKDSTFLNRLDHPSSYILKNETIKKIKLHYKNRMSYLIICLDIGQRDWMNQ